MTSKVWIKMKLLAYVKCLRHISVCKILSSFTLFWEQSRRTKSRWYANVLRYKIWYGAYINVKIGVIQKYLHSDRKFWIVRFPLLYLLYIQVNKWLNFNYDLYTENYNLIYWTCFEFEIWKLNLKVEQNKMCYFL